MILYDSSIDMTAALISQFGDMSIVHETASDELHLLSEPVVSLLKQISHTHKTKDEMLLLISEYCFESPPLLESSEGSETYLQHLVDQGIIKKTQ